MEIEQLAEAHLSPNGEMFRVDRQTGVVYQCVPETEDQGARLSRVTQAERCPGCGQFVCNGLCAA